MKKLTSERLGREGLAAWEERKSNADPEVAEDDGKDDNEALNSSEETAKTEPEAPAGAESALDDEEAQTQCGTDWSPVSDTSLRDVLP